MLHNFVSLSFGVLIVLHCVTIRFIDATRKAPFLPPALHCGISVDSLPSLEALSLISFLLNGYNDGFSIPLHVAVIS